MKRAHSGSLLGNDTYPMPNLDLGGVGGNSVQTASIPVKIAGQTSNLRKQPLPVGSVSRSKSSLLNSSLSSAIPPNNSSSLVKKKETLNLNMLPTKTRAISIALKNKKENPQEIEENESKEITPIFGPVELAERGGKSRGLPRPPSDMDIHGDLGKGIDLMGSNDSNKGEKKGILAGALQGVANNIILEDREELGGFEKKEKERKKKKTTFASPNTNTLSTPSQVPTANTLSAGSSLRSGGTDRSTLRSMNSRSARDKGPFNISLPDGIPTSPLINMPWLEASHQLFDKYIKPGHAPFEMYSLFFFYLKIPPSPLFSFDHIICINIEIFGIAQGKDALIYYPPLFSSIYQVF